ncbi:hypothetical protein R5R35_010293 [Gryllus longicercus]|uniref:Uncharacterized protein n=1 Tax=Gryllus longicercus TaxID=2509291 RepID=A0AAN9Z2R4_9ORTH
MLRRCSFSVSPEPKCFLVSLCAIRMALDRYRTLQLVIEHFEAFAKEHVGKFVNPSLSSAKSYQAHL